MSDVQAIADRVEIEALRGESIDAQMMDDYDRFAALFTPDGVWRVPAVNAEFSGREEIRACYERYFLSPEEPNERLNRLD